MIVRRTWPITVLLSYALLIACQAKHDPVAMDGLKNFAQLYATAWSGRDPAAFASFYAENGSLVINDGEPSVGRKAVEQTAREYMTAFPDMLVELVDVHRQGDQVIFNWHWTGTNTGPGGTGNRVDLTGYEVWTLDDDGLILESRGHLDEAEYRRQLNSGPEGTELNSRRPDPAASD